MADKDFITVAHKDTGVVQSLPRIVVEQVYPDTFKEVSDRELAQLQRKQEKEMFGSYRTALPSTKGGETLADSDPATESSQEGA